ncbi:hypothetical protein SHKM778_68060 [Streptomyces sp. KM77-8]|uniref:CobQ/CobB/MinD/ParA nucleotide binding domain-containing protein n=1 Tax=Streptomyces haneummycinicus TaxID=3074435 RepID=A0AAT9HS80_9ACTN
MAKLLRAPVVLVVDASSQSRSVAALVHGFVSWDPEVRVGGVILNKVASDRHEGLLREALESVGVPVLGALRRAAPVETPSRHLGLVPVAERGPWRLTRWTRWPLGWRAGVICPRWSRWRGVRGRCTVRGGTRVRLWFPRPRRPFLPVPGASPRTPFGPGRASSSNSPGRAG